MYAVAGRAGILKRLGCTRCRQRRRRLLSLPHGQSPGSCLGTTSHVEKRCPTVAAEFSTITRQGFLTGGNSPAAASADH